MNEIRPGSGTPSAVLAGSLSVFPLLDILDLLSHTHHVGALQIVAEGVDEHLWVQNGDLLDQPATAEHRLFELACLDHAWFTVTAAAPPAERTADATMKAPLAPLIAHVAPQVTEWHDLVAVVPFSSIVRLTPSMPAPEVQIKAEQWRILSLVGVGRPVHEVIQAAGVAPLGTLRLLHELTENSLVTIEAAPTPPAATNGSAVHKADGDTPPVAATQEFQPQIAQPITLVRQGPPLKLVGSGTPAASSATGTVVTVPVPETTPLAIMPPPVGPEPWPAASDPPIPPQPAPMAVAAAAPETEG